MLSWAKCSGSRVYSGRNIVVLSGVAPCAASMTPVTSIPRSRKSNETWGTRTPAILAARLEAVPYLILRFCEPCASRKVYFAQNDRWKLFAGEGPRATVVRRQPGQASSLTQLALAALPTPDPRREQIENAHPADVRRSPINLPEIHFWI